MNSNSIEKKLTKKDLKQVFVRSIAYNSSFNYERQLNLGWAFSLMPVLRKLYKDDEEQMKAALARHLEFNNITPFICTVLFGITAAMEEQNANDRDFDTESINAVKVGLMGPLSAIGGIEGEYSGTNHLSAYLQYSEFCIPLFPDVQGV